MREILFRGKTILHNKWVEGAFSMKDCDSPFGEMVDNPSIIKYEEPYSGFWNRVYPETVGQFTGLTDKNGKKIFEGDIVLYEWYERKPMKFQIEYVCGEFLAVPVKKREDVWSIRISAQGKNFEVIGNIHDNPELLEGGAEDD